MNLVVLFQIVFSQIDSNQKLVKMLNDLHEKYGKNIPDNIIENIPMKDMILREIKPKIRNVLEKIPKNLFTSDALNNIIKEFSEGNGNVKKVENDLKQVITILKDSKVLEEPLIKAVSSLILDKEGNLQIGEIEKMINGNFDFSKIDLPSLLGEIGGLGAIVDILRKGGLEGFAKMGKKRRRRDRKYVFR